MNIPKCELYIAGEGISCDLVELLLGRVARGVGR